MKHNPDKKPQRRPPVRRPAERRRHFKSEESSPEGDRTPHTDPDELNPCAHRDTCGDVPNREEGDKDQNSLLNDLLI